jgi:acetylglutamate kinase
MVHSPQKKAGRRILIKFGGNALSGPGDLERFSEDLAALIDYGFRPLIVHGGGPDISQEMEKRGLKVTKVAGLRVTDDAALQVASEVLARINSEIVAALIKAGVKAKGTAGCEDGVVGAEKKPPVRAKDEKGNEVLADLGNVGEVSRVDRESLGSLLDRGIVPVIYPICADAGGRKLNVNADTVAAHVAMAVGAEEMVLMTDVPGILRGGEGSTEVIRSTTLHEIDFLIAAGAITGGMIPKVEACRTALLSGVRVVYMLNGKEPHALVQKLVNGEERGTKIVAG